MTSVDLWPTCKHVTANNTKTSWPHKCICRTGLVEKGMIVSRFCAHKQSVFMFQVCSWIFISLIWIFAYRYYLLRNYNNTSKVCILINLAIFLKFYFDEFIIIKASTMFPVNLVNLIEREILYFDNLKKSNCFINLIQNIQEILRHHLLWFMSTSCEDYLVWE